MIFYEIFERLCKEKGITPTKAARDVGVAQPVVSQWKKRGSTPKAETVQKLADYFGVSVDYLLGKSGENSQLENQLDDFSTHLIEITKDLSEADRQLVLGMARRLRDTGESGSVMTSQGPYYFYNYQDRAGTPTAPAPAGKDTTAPEPPPESPENGG